MAGSLALTGIFSGIDTGAFVTAAMAMARGPLNRLQAQKAEWQAKTSALSGIEGRMEDLQSLVGNLRSTTGLRSVTATSSDQDVLLVTASSGATEGVHDIVVNQLAYAEKEVHAGVTPTETWTHGRAVATGDTEYISASDISDAAGTNYKFVFKFGDEAQVTVDLSAYDLTGITLNELVGEINTAAGYTAASAASLSGQYKLRIQAQDTGEGKDLAITDDDSVGVLDGTGDFTRTFAGDVGADAVVGAGTFVYTYDGVTRTITTTQYSTLGQLRDLINNDGENPGMSASILKYEVDADHVYHLVLTGRSTGADYGITIEAATTLAGFTAGNWTQTQAAQDSKIRVDGYPPDPNWIERSSNTITDVLPGATLVLESTGTATVNFARNTNQLKTDLDNLASIYNGMADQIKSLAGYDAETRRAGILLGDPGINMFLTQIRSILTVPAPGFDSDQDHYTLAAEIGFEIDNEGHFSLDRTVLDEAISEDYEAVLALIGTIGTGGSDTEFVQFNSADEDTTPGVYQVKVDFDAAGVPTDAWIRTYGETEWREAGLDGYVIVGDSDNPEKWLTLTAVADPVKIGAPFTQYAEVRVQKGFAGEMYSELETMLDGSDGFVTLKKDQYQDAIDGLDRRIAWQEDMLAMKEDRLKEKYARLEAMLSQLEGMRAAVDSLVQNLAAISAMNKSN
jgi:flagellar hook-associated protein 2